MLLPEAQLREGDWEHLRAWTLAGGTLVRIAIADVTSLVPAGSAADDHAATNTTSVIETYNQLLEAPGDPLFNRTISGDLYHPGSVFKALVVAAALDSGQFTPETTVPNPPSPMRYLSA